MDNRSRNYRIAIDRGGTFTDCIGNPGTGKHEDDVVIKLLSVDPQNYPDAPLEGIRRLLEVFEGKKIPRNIPLDISKVQSIRMGTTLATNCALERNGERCALITTKGFRDILKIGDQTRPNIFDLEIRRPKPVYDVVLEVDERITLEDYSEDPLTRKSNPNHMKGTYKGKSGEIIRVLKTPDENSVRSMLSILYSSGIRSIAVAFLYSYTYPDHEEFVGNIAQEIGFKHVSLSSEISPMIKFLPRAHSAVADAYLTPVIKSYLESISKGLKNSANTSIQFMHSDGGLVDASNFSGLKSILSGPAGGVVGYSNTSYDAENQIPLIGFDMGGTSTDISRFGNGKFDHIFETVTAGIVIQSPQLDIHTVAAGGSSRLFWENGLFRVGPESATADPGPSCYRKGGPLTITDANLYLGRLIPELFPKIFGPNEDQSLDYEITCKKFDDLRDIINRDLGSHLSTDDVAYGFIKVANESMARPIRAITEAKGYNVSDHRLVAFGGAGGQHAVSVAKSLGIGTILVHRYSSILSAYGIFLADIVEEKQEPCSYILSDSNIGNFLEKKFSTMIDNCKMILKRQDIDENNIKIEKYLNLRYEGTETGLMTLQKSKEWKFEEWFEQNHKREFGFAFNNKKIIVDDIRVRAIGKTKIRKEDTVDTQLNKYQNLDIDTKNYASLFKDIYFEGGRISTPVFNISNLPLGSIISGPAVLADNTQTNIIPPNTEAKILKTHVYIKILERNELENRFLDSINPILLSIFSHRFMDIAEQMGTQLRKTAVSTNVKERLDFSCALFDADGNLVANAPHVPVHLGSMSTCIRLQAEHWKNKLKPGDVIVTNHPDMGGTHLPDITVISPNFSSDGELLFYVASRAHHAEIGGILPGSVPPNSKELYEEGAIVYSELLVSGYVFQEELVYKLFVDEPAKYPNCSGSRRISDNISDLKAQVAANTKGLQLLENLVTEYSPNIVLKYMVAIQDNACDTIKRTLEQLVKHFGKSVFSGHDYMDDGSKIELSIRLDIEKEKYLFDFSGTSPQVYGNLNAPEAITNSAILYCLRCLVGEDIPLNQGCLKPITIKIPKGSILSPNKGAAVVGGNVLTSQRVTDVILKTFGIMADSQGDCNNFTFGTGGGKDKDGNLLNGFGYYETICGGAGAGLPSWRSDGWNGASAVHTNMTNTRMTDTEVLERRYPVLLREFSIRKGSGGNGKYNGGDGVIRDIEFREIITASILSERRVLAPQGINGGQNGKRGKNLWIRKDTGAVINVGGKNTFVANIGDRFIIQTPGGGGCGFE
ncbi:hypothetical protein Kpol_1054p61 [Vanderwaltozyma polyspora DSM 70294]|uniref:5-oxoprolinase n=1 Tax=Vanderwaltozyma polyspora (strain ATCC 22028 / DSM 70294 / BCRC 21397 / CBS 2163 / NBRC 10782 / NRRL Y-8283 / UCD 57-17) TaxID=436907 RepID=A7TIE7_VANPO|nr:uncharacterized protein Kpol_1054p61 [Vanderwaltozyma polyspora DSM 70294]EDO18013.1 hypothetical protein Kpol_1054p61 [Vanderwaltozyma polyspora DSM 70294]